MIYIVSATVGVSLTLEKLAVIATKDSIRVVFDKPQQPIKMNPQALEARKQRLQAKREAQQAKQAEQAATF